jgi:bacterioferritin
MAMKTQRNGRARDQEQEEPRDETRDQEGNESQESQDHEEAKEPTPEKAARPKERETKRDSGRAGREALITGLNHDLAGEYQAILMYTHFAAKLTGPFRKELRALFQGEVADEQGHAQFLADKIAALGGEPTTQPRPVMSADDPRQMLEHALTAEKQAIADYRQRIEQAEAFGDVGLKVELENQIADETRHKEEMERILAGWDRA